MITVTLLWLMSINFSQFMFPLKPELDVTRSENNPDALALQFIIWESKKRMSKMTTECSKSLLLVLYQTDAKWLLSNKKHTNRRLTVGFSKRKFTVL